MEGVGNLWENREKMTKEEEAYHLQSHEMKKRGQELYEVKMIKTKWYKQSAIPYMVNLLNIDYEKKGKK